MNFTSTNTTCSLLASTKVFQAGLIKASLVGVLFLVSSCGPGSDSAVIPEVNVLKSDLVLHANEGKWYLDDQPFNGFGISYHENDTLAERIGFYEGKKEGLAQKWFDTGLLSSEMHYAENRLDGAKRTWWPNGELNSEAYFEIGVVVGVQKAWYNTGQLARLTTVKDGKAEGMQQAWLENGKIYANYEVKNDRIFGMKRSNLCYSLTDEQIENETVSKIDDTDSRGDAGEL